MYIYTCGYTRVNCTHRATQTFILQLPISVYTHICTCTSDPNTYCITQSNSNEPLGIFVDIFLHLHPYGSICFVQHVCLSVLHAIALFSQEERWNRPDVLHSSWPLNFCCTVAGLKIGLARGSGGIVLPQRLVLARGPDDIVLKLFLCSLLTITLEVFRSPFISSLNTLTSRHYEKNNFTAGSKSK